MQQKENRKAKTWVLRNEPPAGLQALGHRGVPAGPTTPNPERRQPWGTFAGPRLPLLCGGGRLVPRLTVVLQVLVPPRPSSGTAAPAPASGETGEPHSFVYIFARDGTAGDGRWGSSGLSPQSGPAGLAAGRPGHLGSPGQRVRAAC